jgi:hypothetical protein
MKPEARAVDGEAIACPTSKTPKAAGRTTPRNMIDLESIAVDSFVRERNFAT